MNPKSKSKPAPKADESAGSPLEWSCRVDGHRSVVSVKVCPVCGTHREVK